MSLVAYRLDEWMNEETKAHLQNTHLLLSSNFVFNRTQNKTNNANEVPQLEKFFWIRKLHKQAQKLTHLHLLSIALTLIQEGKFSLCSRTEKKKN